MGKKILLADADDDISYLLSHRLRAEGYEVERIATAVPLRQHTYTLPDLIILDMKLEIAEDTSLCKHLRKRPELKEIPILMLSSDYNFKNQAIQLGATQFIRKPFETEGLIKLISALLKL